MTLPTKTLAINPGAAVFSEDLTWCPHGNVFSRSIHKKIEVRFPFNEIPGDNAQGELSRPGAARIVYDTECFP